MKEKLNSYHLTRLILGVWVLISPWILGFSGISLAKWSNVLVGTILVLMPLWDIFGNQKGRETE